MSSYLKSQTDLPILSHLYFVLEPSCLSLLPCFLSLCHSIIQYLPRINTHFTSISRPFQNLRPQNTDGSGWGLISHLQPANTPTQRKAHLVVWFQVNKGKQKVGKVWVWVNFIREEKISSTRCPPQKIQMNGWQLCYSEQGIKNG